MRVAIVGAGIAGLTAAHELVKAGHTVTVYEAAAQAGGLASGFRDERWEWPLERFYHHIFTTDKAIIGLAAEIGCADKLFFRRRATAQWWGDRGYALTGARPALRLPGMAALPVPLPDAVAGVWSLLRFPALPMADRLRLTAVLAYLKYGVRDWRPLERSTAVQWTRRFAGDTLYRDFFLPLLEGKFGAYSGEVNMAWLWSRFKARSIRLGYVEGGFQGFVDALLADVRDRGARVLLDTGITALSPLPGGGWRVVPYRDGVASDTWDTWDAEEVDAAIVTGAPGLLARLAPGLPAAYLEGLRGLRSMGAVVLTIALTRPLTKGLYWVNLPKDQFPFLALVEHTNFVGPEHYGGDHLIYCGDYLDPSHEYFHLDKDELLARFLPALKRVNPAFEPSWVRASWLHREAYAQPIVPVNHSRAIPSLATPLPGLFWASMSQVYPWDRGTNFAVELGQRVAREVAAHARPAVSIGQAEEGAARPLAGLHAG